MRGRQSRVLETLRSAQGFLDDNATLLDDVNKSGARKTLDDVVTQLSAHAVTQDGGRRGGKGESANQKTLRRALRFNYMKPIGEVAQLNLRQVPNFAALTLPPSGVKGPKLVAAAGAMADAATPHAQAFVDAGLPADFIPQLRAAAGAVTASLDQRAQSIRQSAGATTGLAAQEVRGRRVLRLLDCLVIPKLGTDDQRLAEWKSARKVHAKPGPVNGRAGSEGSGAPPSGGTGATPSGGASGSQQNGNAGTPPSGNAGTPQSSGPVTTPSNGSVSHSSGVPAAVTSAAGESVAQPVAQAA